jgi:pimeloyl-ACP methyl ester carboxylesterase
MLSPSVRTRCPHDAEGTHVSTPPRVTLPPGVSVEEWDLRDGHRAVMHSGLDECDSWIVMIPGFTGSKEDFIALPDLLVNSGVGMLTFDQFGQFESASSDDPAAYALDVLAEDVGSIIAVARERFGRSDSPHLLGHSFGGLVAQQALVQHGLNVRSFTAFCTGPGALPPDRWGALPELVAALPHTDLSELWQRKVELDEAAGVPAPPQEIQEFLRTRWVRNHPNQLKQFAHTLMEQSSFTDRLRPRVDAGLEMAVVWGEFDDAWPISTQQRMANELGVTGVEIPGVGHSPNAEAPELTVQTLLRVLGH